MAAHAEMRERATSIFVTDVALADIARQDGDLYRRVECASLAPTHDCVTRYRGASWGQLLPADPSGYRSEDSVAARPAGAVSAARALALLCLIDLQCTATEVGAVQSLHGTRCIGIRHLHEGEATGTTRVAIIDQRHRFDGSVCCKQGTHAFVSCRERKISNV